MVIDIITCPFLNHRKDPDDERREEQITLDTRPIITPLSNPNQNNCEQSNHPYMEKEMAEAMSHMKSAPGLGSEYTIDAAKDSVIDEYEVGGGYSSP